MQYCICSQINSFTEKFPLMEQLNSYFRIPCKSSSDIADLLTQPQTLYYKQATEQDSINFYVY